MAEAFRMWLKNERQFRASMKAKSRKIQDQRGVMLRALSMLEKRMRRGILQQQVETADVGQGRFWKLTRKYAAQKAKRFGPGLPILFASGAMMLARWFQKSVRITWFQGKVKGVLRYKAPRKIQVRALTHQKPVTWEGPRRKWFGFRRGDTEAIWRLFAFAIKRALRM